MGEPVHTIALTYNQARLTYLANSVAGAHLIRFLTVRAFQDLDRTVSSAYPIATTSCQGPLWMEMEKTAFAQVIWSTMEQGPAETIAPTS